MKRNNKSILLLCIIMVLGAIALIGCGGEVVTEPEKPEEPEMMRYEVNLYFINEEYVETGDESLDKLLSEQRTINVSEGENVYLTLLESLSLVTKEGTSTMVTDTIVFNDVYLSQEDEETIVVDLGDEGLSSGSLGEGLFISQVVETLLDNENLNDTSVVPMSKVQFLVNGQITESLMGHISAEEPFTSELQ